MATTKCPYCWTSHRRNKLHMRCGESCDHRGRPFPERALKNGRCPHGQLPQSRRACPHCGRELLREYVDGGGRNIAVIGSADSGKSTWVGVLVHEFQGGQVSQRFAGMSLNLLGEESRLRYHRDFDTPLFEERRPLPQTASARVKAPEPLMFSLRFRRKGPFGATRVDSVVTVFYDTAGEDVARAEAMDQLISYLNAAEGIILLLDPLQMPKVREHVGFNDAKTGYTNQRYVLDRLSELLRQRRDVNVKKRLRTPLAIALTKFDLLSHMFAMDSPLHQPSRHAGVYDDADGLDVHEEVRAWLNKWYDPAFDNSIANAFKDYRYFGMSALGAQPVDGNHLAPQGVHPYRLEDPMLWLLARFGAVRMTKGKR